MKVQRRATRWRIVGGPAARSGSSSAPQCAQPAAKAPTRSPQRGPMCDPNGLMEEIQVKAA